MVEDEFRVRIALLSALYDKAIQANSVFITAGYATFFGAWALTRDLLSHPAMVWSCLFLLVSAMLFIAWQVYAVVSLGLVVRHLGPATLDGWADRVTLRVLQANAGVIQRLGIPVTLITALLGLSGVIILGVGLLRSL